MSAIIFGCSEFRQGSSLFINVHDHDKASRSSVLMDESNHRITKSFFSKFQHSNASGTWVFIRFADTETNSSSGCRRFPMGSDEKYGKLYSRYKSTNFVKKRSWLWSFSWFFKIFQKISFLAEQIECQAVWSCGHDDGNGCWTNSENLPHRRPSGEWEIQDRRQPRHGNSLWCWPIRARTAVKSSRLLFIEFCHRWNRTEALENSRN